MVTARFWPILQARSLAWNIRFVFHTHFKAKYLRVGGRIPVRIEDDHSIGASKVYAQASHSSREEKDEYVRVLKPPRERRW